MSVELFDKSRLKLIEEYGFIFEARPNLKKVALSYWKQVQGKNSEQEEKLFESAVLEISNQLLDDPVFLAAMDQEGDPMEHAIIESFFIIDIVLDV